MVEEQSEETRNRRYVVRYGIMRSLGTCEARRGESFRRGDDVIIRSERGVDWGVILCPMNEQASAWLSNSRTRNGRILRAASDDDRRQRSKATADQRRLFQKAAALIQEFRLVMQPIDLEQVFGGEKIILYYLAENRIDFRELVRAMAREFNTRVELRHVGIRDEAKLLADYGDCGKPVCCNTHLQETPPVSMKMAKLQKASLDPNKISGRCGRLKCCLRYEYDTYAEHQRELPAVGATVLTRNGKGRVVSQEILSRRLMVQFEDGRRQITEMTDIVTVVSGGNRSGKRKQAQPNGATAEDSSTDAR